MTEFVKQKWLQFLITIIYVIIVGVLIYRIDDGYITNTRIIDSVLTGAPIITALIVAYWFKP